MTKLVGVRKLRNAEAAFIVRGGNQGDLHLIAPWCNRPVPISRRAPLRKALPDVVKNGKGNDQVTYSAELNLGVACRRCAGCLDHKRRLWGSRAYWETLHSVRTWFGTLTFTPEEHVEGLRAAMSLAWQDGIDYHRLGEAEQLALNARALLPHVQQFLKRLRKGAKPSADRPKGRPPAKFRYLLVFEPHESGLVHFHMLIHETSTTPLLKADLEDQWGAHISHWRLVPTTSKKEVWYVCKYLSKEAAYKPRASLFYGQPFKSGRSRRVAGEGQGASPGPRSGETPAPEKRERQGDHVDTNSQVRSMGE